MDEEIFVCKYCGLKWSLLDSRRACEEWHEVCKDGAYSFFMANRHVRAKEQRALDRWLL